MPSPEPSVLFNSKLLITPTLLLESLGPPSTSSTPMFYTLLVVVLVAYLSWARIKQSKRAPLPPGPAGYPIIGNLLELPHSYPWLGYADWAKRYGGVLSFKVFGRPAIIVSSAKAATELFEKRSTNYSDRPRMVISAFLKSLGRNLIYVSL